MAIGEEEVVNEMIHFGKSIAWPTLSNGAVDKEVFMEGPTLMWWKKSQGVPHCQYMPTLEWWAWKTWSNR